MPQFEVEDLAAQTDLLRVRARTPEEAVRIWLGLPQDADIKFGKGPGTMDELEGWKEIQVAGQPRGRIRPFQRMRFRRD